ncbi:hypothetical protein QZR14_13050 [Pseudomonas sp. rhizo66]|uniref:hypothetical protein n=1 Tax=Pseudomonas sp. rhizo66 TaxID=3059674 RepID=UPI002891665C|nr:hypothetical protein [Pseudomonas sp. rhizo66]MDT3312281.1 hypothetical protein [Pseudomonas sp. rhizo66]
MRLLDIMNFIASLFDGLLSKEVAIALVAAYIGARATSKSTIRAHELATQKSKNDERAVTCNTLRLIKAELTTAWDIYMYEYGKGLLLVPDDSPYIMMLPIGDNPFPIYDSAPPCLANIDPSVSAKIVRIYMRTKGLITMIKLNNVDCQAVYNAGRFATQKLVNKAIADGAAIDEAGARKINDYHIFYVDQEANQLGMGGTANGMKLLTGELEILLNNIKRDIDNLTSET